MYAQWPEEQSGPKTTMSEIEAAPKFPDQTLNTKIPNYSLTQNP